jgi:DNA mismatch repair protein MutS2
LLKDTNKQIEATIKQIRDSNAEKEPTKQARQELETFVAQELKLEPKTILRSSVAGKTLQPGDKVALIGQESEGEIVAVKGNTAEVRFGDLKTIVKVANLERVEGTVKKLKKEKEVASAGFSRGLDLTKRMSDFTTTLDVRGERAEDALTRVMSFLDDAVMLGIPEIKIVHGRGNGILKQIIRDYLRSQREVASISDEIVERGGDGASLVVLK